MKRGLFLDKTKLLFSERTMRIMVTAEEELLITNQDVVQPIHLLIACLHEKNGAFGEIVLKTKLEIPVLRVEAANQTRVVDTIQSDYFKYPISTEVDQILTLAKSYMERYNQIYINEGHVLKALLANGAVDHFVTEEDKHLLLTLGTTARDMIKHLGNYTFPNLTMNNVRVRKVIHSDRTDLLSFVETNFSPEWAQTIRGGFTKENMTMYIALNDKGNPVGFAAFDVYQNKKGYFGPMGVCKSSRVSGVGYSLLHHCLKEMKEVGYEYAIIGGAGPIEFYEKACNAVVIPMH